MIQLKYYTRLKKKYNKNQIIQYIPEDHPQKVNSNPATFQIKNRSNLLEIFQILNDKPQIRNKYFPVVKIVQIRRNLNSRIISV